MPVSSSPIHTIGECFSGQSSTGTAESTMSTSSSSTGSTNLSNPSTSLPGYSESFSSSIYPLLGPQFPGLNSSARCAELTPKPVLLRRNKEEKPPRRGFKSTLSNSNLVSGLRRALSTSDHQGKGKRSGSGGSTGSIGAGFFNHLSRSKSRRSQDGDAGELPPPPHDASTFYGTDSSSADTFPALTRDPSPVRRIGFERAQEEKKDAWAITDEDIATACGIGRQSRPGSAGSTPAAYLSPKDGSSSPYVQGTRTPTPGFEEFRERTGETWEREKEEQNTAVSEQGSKPAQNLTESQSDEKPNRRRNRGIIIPGLGVKIQAIRPDAPSTRAAKSRAERQEITPWESVIDPKQADRKQVAPWEEIYDQAQADRAKIAPWETQDAQSELLPLRQLTITGTRRLQCHAPSPVMAMPPTSNGGESGLMSERLRVIGIAETDQDSAGILPSISQPSSRPRRASYSAGGVSLVESPELAKANVKTPSSGQPSTPHETETILETSEHHIDEASSSSSEDDDDGIILGGLCPRPDERSASYWQLVTNQRGVQLKPSPVSL